MPPGSTDPTALVAGMTKAADGPTAITNIQNYSGVTLDPTLSVYTVDVSLGAEWDLAITHTTTSVTGTPDPLP